MAKLDGTRIKRVLVKKRQLDSDMQTDILDGKGIRLRSTESFKKSEKVKDGLQSPFFGTDFTDEASYSARFSCDCGYTVGAMYENELCPKCGTPVQFVPVDLTKCGWITVDNFYVMSPIYAAMLSTALGSIDGKLVLDLILETDYEDNLTGAASRQRVVFSMEKEAEIRKKHPYIHKGMIWLHDHFNEVMDYYISKKASKKKLFTEMKNNKDQVFTHSINVVSAILRSEMPGEKDRRLEKFRINTIYQSLIRNSNSINALGDPKTMGVEDICTVNRYLCSMHKNIIKLFDEIFNILNGKTGIIQSRVLAGRYNFSARNIISASSGDLRANEIEFCYIGFLELYRYEITNIYAKLMHCTIQAAQQAWHNACVHFDKVIYGIMQYMLIHDRDEIGVLINRNPSINFGSFLYVKIKSVKPDISDKTLRLNTRVITVMNADFDGDQINVFRIIGRKMNKTFAATLDPTYNLYVDRVNGRCNKDMMPLKDEVVGLYYFNSCD